MTEATRPARGVQRPLGGGHFLWSPELSGALVCLFLGGAIGMGWKPMREAMLAGAQGSWNVSSFSTLPLNPLESLERSGHAWREVGCWTVAIAAGCWALVIMTRIGLGGWRWNSNAVVPDLKRISPAVNWSGLVRGERLVGLASGGITSLLVLGLGIALGPRVAPALFASASATPGLAVPAISSLWDVWYWLAGSALILAVVVAWGRGQWRRWSTAQRWKEAQAWEESHRPRYRSRQS